MLIAAFFTFLIFVIIIKSADIGNTLKITVYISSLPPNTGQADNSNSLSMYINIINITA